MKVDFFMPEYMANFKCIGPQCVDTCCAGWDINIDENTYKNYKNSKGKLKEIVKSKFTENIVNNNFFNTGLMILKDNSICPFLNEAKLCDIHGDLGEEHLCITCKSFPRIYNVVDGIYEKSGLPSCEEICRVAFLNKNKMNFIETEEVINEEELEIRRLIDSDAFEEENSILQYFWDIRILSINIIQNRKYKIHERFEILRNVYKLIEDNYNKENFEKIEKILNEVTNSISETLLTNELDDKFNTLKVRLLDDNLDKSIKSIYLKEISKDFKSGIGKYSSNTLDELYLMLDEYDYIFENYIVNQIFKDLIPFNKEYKLLKSINILINSYKIIILYIAGIILSGKYELTEKLVIKVIQCFSKDVEHNKVFYSLLEL